MLRIVSGRNHLLCGELLGRLGEAMGQGEDALTVVVPRQLTLETELALLDGLSLEGSFRLRVISPERLCGLIFDAAGRPAGERVDERGRAMLLSRAMKRLEGELTLYRGAQSRRGFVGRAARQVEIFRQAGLSPEDVRALAREEAGSLARKLEDVAAILEAYERELEGRYEDGEGELLQAAQRAGDAAFLRGARLWFYGFDLMPPTLHRLIAAVAAVAEATVLLPMDPDPHARDEDLFRPLRASAARLAREARLVNANVAFEPAREVPHAMEDLRFLCAELFSWSAHTFSASPGHIQLFAARSPREEARFAAALTRRLVRARGWRWRDVLVLVPSVDAYRQPLREAFAECGVPLFLAEGRPCARRPLCECLLTALSIVSRGARDEDMHACLASGFLPVDARDAGRLRNYAVSWGVRAGAFLRPFTRGGAALVEALEPIRAAAMAPLVALRERMRAAGTLREQLAAVFGFLEDINAYESCLARQSALCEAGLYEEAGEEAQVWNRLLGALDQMAELLGEERLRVEEIAEHLREALDAAVVRPLPQSGDAVLALDAGKLRMRPARAVLLLGQTERAAGAADALLTDRQLESLSSRANRYLGLTPSEAARTRLFYAKAGLENATDYVCVSYPLAGLDGAAERPGQMVLQLRRVFPALPSRGGVTADAAVEEMLYEAPDAALSRLSAALCEELSPAQERALRSLAASPEHRARLEALEGALASRGAADRLRPETARRLFDGLTQASVSRLEAFAACPFSHFMRYAIRPEIIQPYALTPRDEGTFFHAAVRGFLSDVMQRGELDSERAAARMDQVSETLLAPLREGPLGQSALSRAEERRLRDVARTSARLIVEQLADSHFEPVGLEVRFGPEDGDATLRVGEGRDCALYGSIDRIDEWREGEARFVRVLDYKRGSRPFSMAEAWAGLQLQLLVYLAAAAKKRGALAAGAFYFRMSDGYLLCEDTRPEAVEAARRKSLRMDGPVLQDERAADALSREPGAFYRSLRPLPEQAMDRLIARALEMASQHADGIREGVAAPSPAATREGSACRYCEWRSACLFDERTDGVRRVRTDDDAVYDALCAQEDGQ